MTEEEISKHTARFCNDLGRALATAIISEIFEEFNSEEVCEFFKKSSKLKMIKNVIEGRTKVRVENQCRMISILIILLEHGLLNNIFDVCDGSYIYPKGFSGSVHEDDEASTFH